MNTPAEEGGQRLVAVRLRGSSGLTHEVELTLRSLRLLRIYTAVILDDRPEVTGMLRKAKDTLTWGKASGETISLLLKKRGRIEGGAKLTDSFAKNFNLTTLDELGTSVAEGQTPLGKLWESGVKPYFSLHPPTGGFHGTIRRPFSSSGELGYRGKAIRDLISKMV